MNKLLLRKFYCIFVVGAISYIYDIHRRPCNAKPEVSLVHWMHHVYSAYLWFGVILFGFDPYYHLVVSIITFSLWNIFGWKCFVTMFTNELCGRDIDDNHDDIMNLISRAACSSVDYYVFVILAILVDLFYIFKIKRNF